MAKINKEEYEILKDLGVEWNWIARDEMGVLDCYIKKPKKYKLILKLWSDNISPPRYIDGSNFQFVQWEDEEPYEIAELIDEYEKEYHIKNVKLDASNLAGNASDYKHFYKRLGESEETEVKKDIEWLKEEIGTEMIQLEPNRKERWTDVKYQTLRDVAQKISQLDEPEVLSQNWIDEHEIHYNHWVGAVPVTDLQNLLVPKQEEVDQAYKDGYEKGKQHTFYKGYLEGLADKESETETVADVIADFYKSRERLKEVLGTKVEELEE